MTRNSIVMLLGGMFLGTIGGFFLGVMGAVYLVRVKTGTSFSAAINVTKEMQESNRQFLANYSLSAMTSANALRRLEEQGEEAARAALWQESKRIYFDQMNSVPRSQSEILYGMDFKKFVDSTSSLTPYVEAELGQNKSEIATPRKPSD